MSHEYKSYKIYRTLLRLYPKSHKDAYEQQMVQTLDDILSDQSSAYGRIAVWAGVICELPINIIEENISNNMEGISVNKLSKITNKQYLYLALAILVVGSYAVIAMSWQHQRTAIGSLDKQLQAVSENQFAMSGGSYNAATIIPSENAVYFPLAKLKVADNTLNEGLVYNYKAGRTALGSDKVLPAEISISTHDLAVNNYPRKQFDCSQVVYADFVTPSYPVNPMWKSNGGVKLADGRTMNVYYAPSIPGCEQSWQMSNVKSKAIADSLKQAVSY